MNIIEQYLTSNPTYTSPSKITPTGLMLHSIGAPQESATVIINNMNSSSANVSIHGVIGGDGSTYKTLPWEKGNCYKAWHCGNSNSKYIGVEMCEPNHIVYTTGAIFSDSNPNRTKQVVDTMYKSAVELFAYLCNEHGLSASSIISHNEGRLQGIATAHHDPEHIWSRVGRTMDQFRIDVGNRMKGNTNLTESVIGSSVNLAADTNTAMQKSLLDMINESKNITFETSENFEYTDELDNAITNMLQNRSDYKDVFKDVRVFGTPHRFLKTTDYQPFLPEIAVGRKYLENILAEAPIVYFAPGMPNYLPNFTADQRAIVSEYITARYNNQSITDEIKNVIFKEDGRYFEFIAAYADYIQYVNLLCRVCSVYMGISEKNVPGTTEKYKNYDWSRYINLSPPVKDEYSKKGIWEETKEELSLFKPGTVIDAIFGNHRYLRCYVDPNASFSESMNNSTVESKIGGLFDTVEGLVKEFNFVFGGDTSTAIQNGLGSVMGTMGADTAGSSNFAKMIGLTEHVITGSNIIFPELWGDSSYNKSYDFTIHLLSPYGDPESIYLNIIVPMMHIIALAMPRQTSANSFMSPFLVKVFCKGWFSCDMGIIDSISIEKNQEHYNVNGLPNEVTIKLSVKDLYSNLMITKASKPNLFFNNQGLMEFLTVTCGVNITDINIFLQIESFISTYLNTLYDLPNRLYNNIIESLRNRIDVLFR